MDNKTFYDIIDKEIDSILSQFPTDDFLNKQDANGKKSYGFILWFLRKYLPEKPIEELKQYITEGNDDTSCDLIFENTNSAGEKIFYVVQAKWFTKNNISSTNEMTKDFKACLSDFRIILNGSKKISQVNENFNRRYQDFLEHKKSNGKIKFIFLTLCRKIDNYQEHLENFTNALVSFDFFDFFKLKKQFIDIEYKGAKTHNPIEIPYEPKGKIILKFVKGEYISIKDPLPYKSYIFLVKPSQIYSLIESYGLAVFYKNIRNPLASSLINKKIVETITKNPLNFWYFNNGVTAITDGISDFYEDSDNVAIKGIQIINGAQTVYSIHYAYKNASEEDRNRMEDNALISLRILKSGGVDFDLQVTRFTNSQNPTYERDFYSNDDVQTRLQNDFLQNTKIWYETRRGEFVPAKKKLKELDVEVVSNEDFGQLYLAYYLQNPYLAKAYRSKIFVSMGVSKDGLYETIFNSETNYQDMLIAYKLYNYIEEKRKNKNKKTKGTEKEDSGEPKIDYPFIQYASFEILALFKILLEKVNNENTKAIFGKMSIDLNIQNGQKFGMYYNYIISELNNFVTTELKGKSTQLSVYFKSKGAYSEISKTFNYPDEKATREMKL